MRAGHPEGTAWPWASHPYELLPEEQDSLAWRSEVDSCQAASEAAQLASALLRRLGLVHGTPKKRCFPFYDLWSDAMHQSSGTRLFHLEWGSYPTSPQLAEWLTNADSPIALPPPLRCNTEFLASSGWMRLYTSGGSQALLRHNPLEGERLDRDVEIPEHGPYRSPFAGVPKVDDLTALELMVRALTGEYALLPRRELRVTHRSEGGWELHPSTTAFRYGSHLRQVALCRSYPHLWSGDLQNMAQLYDGREIVRLRGVDFVLHYPWSS